MRKFTADFETTTDVNDCRVWAAGICNIESLDFTYGNSIEWFIDFMESNPGSIFYFHNLKFDGEFIIHWLLTHGFTHVESKRNMKTKTFSTLISDAAQFYTIDICFDGDKSRNRKKKVQLIDSLKILTMSVNDIAKAFKLPIEKMEIDYSAKREIGHTLTETEVTYLKNDVEIMARALKILFDQGLDKLTQGANALADFKKMFTEKRMKKTFPVLAYDADIRLAYKGGFTYCNPRFRRAGNWFWNCIGC